MKPIEELASECNGDLTLFDNEPLSYTFAIANLEKFREAIIKDFVKSHDTKLKQPEHFINQLVFRNRND